MIPLLDPNHKDLLEWNRIAGVRPYKFSCLKFVAHLNCACVKCEPSLSTAGSCHAVRLPSGSLVFVSSQKSTFPHSSSMWNKINASLHVEQCPYL